MQKSIESKNSSLLKWFVPYVLVASLQFQFTKDALIYSSPFVLMALRFVSVGGILYFVGGRKMLINLDTLMIAIFAGSSSLVWTFGLRIVSPGDSAVLSYTMPLFSIPIAYIIIGERSSMKEIIGAVIGFCGVLIYSLTLSHGSLLLGVILTLLNAMFWAAYSVYYRKLRDKEPIPVLTTQFLFGSIPMIVGSFFLPQLEVTGDFLIDLFYVIVFTGLIQYYLWNGLLRRARVGKITTMAFAVPAITILIDAVRTFSMPDILVIGGASVMFLGVFVSSWNKRS